jgi:hypothetical protein
MPKKMRAGLRLFNEEMAERVLNNFLQHGNGCDELLVHCHAGQERSPALAMGLRDKLRLKGRIFKIGVVDGSLTYSDASNSNSVLEFPYYDAHVYSTLMNSSPAEEFDLSQLSLHS